MHFMDTTRRLRGMDITVTVMGIILWRNDNGKRSRVLVLGNWRQREDNQGDRTVVQREVDVLRNRQAGKLETDSGASWIRL